VNNFVPLTIIEAVSGEMTSRLRLFGWTTTDVFVSVIPSIELLAAIFPIPGDVAVNIPVSSISPISPMTDHSIAPTSVGFMSSSEPTTLN